VARLHRTPAEYLDVNQALTRYFAFYNARRPHQALDQRTPDAVYFGSGELKQAA